jgi:hypothetical protein
MKITKRENKALQKRLVSIFEGILEDAETQFQEAVLDEIQSLLEDDDDVMDIFEPYFYDATETAYKNRAKGGAS